MAIFEGLRWVKRRLFPSLADPDPFPIDAWTDPAYAAWFERHKATMQELNAQRSASLSQRPCFSIVVPLFRTPIEYLCDMVDSVLGQTYDKLELILVNASPGDAALAAKVSEYHENDSRVRCISLPENRGIAGNTAVGIAQAEGDFVCFLDHDDFLEPDALFRFAVAVDDDPSIDVLYCDEDLVERMQGKGFVHKHPFFKPSYSPELMLCKNGIIHLMTIRRELLLGMPEPDRCLDGAQDYSMVLYAIARARGVHHVPRVLYHWRINEGSTANDPDAKPYARLASRVAVAQDVDDSFPDARIIGSGIVNTQNLWFGSPDARPVVSMIVDCGDDLESLDAFMELFRQTNSYESVEVIAVWIEGEGSESSRVMACDAEVVGVALGSTRFARFNAGAEAAAGEYLVFMDANASFQTPEPLEQLLGFCMREGVGAVAPKTLYADGSVRCYGVAVTSERIMPLYRGYPDDFPGYQCNLRSFQNSSAASYLGLMTSRALFRRLGGFDEGYEGEIGTAEYCRRLLESGQRIASMCTVKLQAGDRCSLSRYDNATNAPDFTLQDLERFDEKWPGVRAAGDPYFNCNLDQSSSYFQVARS